jgi:hypothetical protein
MGMSEYMQRLGLRYLLGSLARFAEGSSSLALPARFDI